MDIKTINRTIGYGILLFTIGIFAGVFWIKYIQILIPIGSLMTFTGVFLFFKETRISEQFDRKPKEDVLTYFWNVIVLKLWTCVFVVAMLVLTLAMAAHGWLLAD